MRLIVKLRNPQDEVTGLQVALRLTDIGVSVEDEKLVLEAETRTNWNYDLSDGDSLDAVWAEAHQLIAIINGAAAVDGVTLNRIELMHVMYVDSEQRRQHLPNNGRGEMILPGFRMQPPDAAPLIYVGLQDAAAAKALRLFGPDLDWGDLYKIYEVIKNDATKRQIIDSGWASATEIEAFTTSANHPVISGDHSRHGVMDGTPRKAAMSLSIARHVIRTILRSWLASKATAQKKGP